MLMDRVIEVARLGRILFIVGLLMIIMSGLLAQAGDDGLEGAESIWVPVTLEVHGKDPDSRLYATLGIEPRLTSGFVKEFDEILIHPGLGFRLTDTVALEAGYTWLGDTNRSDRDFAVDQRLWQGVTWKKEFGKLALNARNRIEERWLPGADSLHVRNRSLLGARYRLGDSRWYLSNQNELFVNFADAGIRPEGVDQFRIFAGLGRSLGKRKSASVEAGYQLQYARRREPDPNRLNHIMMVRMNYRVN